MFNARHSVQIVDDIIKDEEPETVPVMLMKSMIVKTIGEVTKKEYIFNGGGSIVNIDKEDVEGMMKKNKARQSCCGTLSSPYFKFI